MKTRLPIDFSSETNMLTDDGLRVYDLDPQASELWVVAGPDNYDESTIDTDDLPDGFRWVGAYEWQMMTGGVEIEARAKAFSGEGVKTHRFLIKSGEVRVWDDVAGYYTTCHSLSRSAQRRIRKLAAAE